MNAQSASGAEIPMPQQSFPVEKAERMDFLLDIYPHGIGYAQLLANVKKAYQTSDAKAKEKSDKILAEMVGEGWIAIKARRDGSKSVLLSKKGFGIITQYLQVLKQSNKRKYFAHLKSWMIAGNDTAKFAYSRSAMEIFLAAPEIACMLVTPHLEIHLVDYYARITGKPPDEKTRAFVMDYVGMLVGLGFAKMNKVRDDASGQDVVAYYLLKEGRDVMEMMFKTISGSASSIASKNVKMPKSSNPVMAWLSFCISFAIVLVITLSISPSLVSQDTSSAAVLVVGFLATLMPTAVTFMIAVIGSIVRKMKK